MKRCYLLYVPTGYDPALPLPLVFSLHGFSSQPEGQQYLSGWESIADKENFLVVYPQGSSFPLRWNSSPVANVGTIDDVQFIGDMIADVSEISSMDPTRIYVTGMSNGGWMTHRIACELSGSVAAVGVVSGMGDEIPGGCNPSHPIPVIAFFGTSDQLVFYEGGSVEIPTAVAWLLNLATGIREFPSVNTWIEAWAERNQCNLTPEIIPASGDVSGLRFTGCNENAEVVLYSIDDGGHTWPGGPSILFVSKTGTDINASATMWEFFKDHALNAP